MAFSRSIRGRVAAVKWAYFNAAAIDGYAIAHDRVTGWSATGSLIPGAIDAYKMAQRPLYLVVPYKRGAWRWEIRTIATLDGGRFTATLGDMTTEGINGITYPSARR